MAKNMTGNSDKADIRELQVDLKYIRQIVDEIKVGQKYTNGKVAESILKIKGLEDTVPTLATKEELQDVAIAPAVEGHKKWESWKVLMISTGVGILSSGITAFLIVKFVH